MFQTSAAEKALLTILERLPISVAISDPRTGRILWVNARDLRLVAATDPQQVIGRNLLDFLTPEQQEIALKEIDAVSRGETAEPTVYQLRRFDGGTAHVQIATVPIVYRGAPAMLSLVADVSEREEALRQLAESEERYRALVECSPDGIVVCAGDAIAYVNPTLLATMRATEPSDMVGRTMFDFIDPSFHGAVRGGRKRLFMKAEALPASRVVMTRLDGTSFPASVQSAPVHWQGEMATQTIIREVPETGA